MKPGMQRDMLAAILLLFDEFEIGNGTPPAVEAEGQAEKGAKPAKDAAKAKPRGNNHRTRRRS